MTGVPRREPPEVDYGPMADLYDALARFDRDIPFFTGECLTARGPVLELMAGTGRLSIPLIEAGVPLTCVDRCEAMLEILRGKLRDRGLRARVVSADVREMILPERYPLTILPFQSFEELADPEDRDRALEAIRRTLAPGGRFVCTLNNPPVRLCSLGPGTKSLGRERDPLGAGEIEFSTRLEHDPSTGVVEGVQIFERFAPDGHVVEREEMPIRFALIGREAFEDLVSEHGFAVEALHGDYDRAAFDAVESPYMIWSLRGPG